MSDQIIKRSCSRTSQFVREQIELLKSDLVSFTKKEIDIALVWFESGLHGHGGLPEPCKGETWQDR